MAYRARILRRAPSLGALLLLSGCVQVQEPTDLVPTSNQTAKAASPTQMSPIVDSQKSAANTRNQKSVKLDKAFQNMSSDDLALQAERLYNGYGIQRDVPKALGLFRLAAEKGSGYACRRLGLEYSDFAFDDFTPRDDKLARSWFEKGSKLGDSECMFYLSEFVFEGRGGPKDEQRATQLLLQSARSDSQAAAHRLLKLNRKGSLQISEEDKMHFYILDKQLRNNILSNSQSN